MKKKDYPTDINDEEKNNGFKVTKIESSENYGNIYNIPTENTIDAIVKEISTNKRVVKVESPVGKKSYVYEENINGKWKLKGTYNINSQTISNGL